jgi:hypothetical protein
VFVVLSWYNCKVAGRIINGPTRKKRSPFSEKHKERNVAFLITSKKTQSRSYPPMLAVGSDESPTSYLRKPQTCVNSQTDNNAAAGCDQPAEARRQCRQAAYGQCCDRGQYNRLLGEMLREENLFESDGLPSLDKLGYSDDFFKSMSTVKKTRNNSK